ncbi:MAG: hypothetical protein U0W24_18545 [Bacteroidales bacterium]
MMTNLECKGNPKGGCTYFFTIKNIIEKKKMGTDGLAAFFDKPAGWDTL